jgi:hypothetical protein
MTRQNRSVMLYLAVGTTPCWSQQCSLFRLDSAGMPMGEILTPIKRTFGEQ